MNVSVKGVAVYVNRDAQHSAVMHACVCIFASVFYKCPLSNQRTFCCKLSICALLALLISQIGLLLAELSNELEVVSGYKEAPFPFVLVLCT